MYLIGEKVTILTKESIAESGNAIQRCISAQTLDDVFQ